RFHACAEHFVVANAAAPQSRMRRLMHDRGRYEVRGGCLGKHKALIEFAGFDRRDVACHRSGNETNPYTGEVFAEAVVAARVMDLDEAQRLLDAPHNRCCVGLEIGADPETVNSLATREPEHDPVAQGRLRAQFRLRFHAKQVAPAAKRCRHPCRLIVTPDPASTLPFTSPQVTLVPASTLPPTAPQITLVPASTFPPTAPQVTLFPASTLPAIMPQ